MVAEKLNVNPTRMELKRLKSRLKTAQRGHKLLKDKTDEMVRKFIVFARENKRLREEVEERLASALAGFMLARATDTPQAVEEAIMMPSRSVELECGNKSMMGIAVPSVTVKENSTGGLFPYGFKTVTAELDKSIGNLNNLMTDLIRLSEAEKICNMLADEIEKNKRRVNALENVMIPQLEATIKYITMKLDENERSSLVRLMKVKSMIEGR